MIEKIELKTIEKFEKVYSELTAIKDEDARRGIAGLIAQPEFEIF